MRIAVGSLLLAAVFCCIPATGAQSPPRYTNTWAVEVEGGKRMADAVAAKYGFVNKGSVGSLKDMYEFALPEGAYVQEHDNTVAAVQVTETLIREHPVKFAQQQVEQRMVRKGYSPPTDPKWSSQWQLVSPRLQVERAWIQGYTGCGVTVGVLDDGVDYNNEDLKKNYVRLSIT
jgi:subtilisin family serine protease